MKNLDPQMLALFGGVLGLLAVSSVIGFILDQRYRTGPAAETIDNMNTRIRAWWIMCIVFGGTMVVGPIGSLVLFSLMSIFALREYITLTPTHRADHRTLFWAFFVITPLQYFLIATRWYGFFSILIPVYAFLFIPTRIAFAGDTVAFLERTSKIQWGLMICVYSLSYAPALLTLEIPGYEQRAKLLLYLVVVDQLSDVLQYCYGKLFGRHPIAPNVSPNKTWEGFVGGVLTATLIGTALWWVTPFTPVQSFVMSLVITLLGFFGGLTMSAIKRDRGVKDYGSIIRGHGGMLDRIDSMCFAAPVFFHLTRFFFTPPVASNPVVNWFLGR